MYPAHQYSKFILPNNYENVPSPVILKMHPLNIENAPSPSILKMHSL